MICFCIVVTGSMKFSSRHGSRIETFAKLEGNMIYMGNFVVIIVICSVAIVA